MRDTERFASYGDDQFQPPYDQHRVESIMRRNLNSRPRHQDGFAGSTPSDRSYPRGGLPMARPPVPTEYSTRPSHRGQHEVRNGGQERRQPVPFSSYHPEDSQRRTYSDASTSRGEEHYSGFGSQLHLSSNRDHDRLDFNGARETPSVQSAPGLTSTPSGPPITMRATVKPFKFDTKRSKGEAIEKPFNFETNRSKVPQYEPFSDPSRSLVVGRVSTSLASSNRPPVPVSSSAAASSAFGGPYHGSSFDRRISPEQEAHQNSQMARGESIIRKNLANARKPSQKMLLGPPRRGRGGMGRGHMEGGERRRRSEYAGRGAAAHSSYRADWDKAIERVSRAKPIIDESTDEAVTPMTSTVERDLTFVAPCERGLGSQPRCPQLNQSSSGSFLSGFSSGSPANLTSSSEVERPIWPTTRRLVRLIAGNEDPSDKLSKQILKHVDSLQQKMVMMTHGSSPNSETLSLILEHCKYPHEMLLRKEDQLLRPVLIDVCGVAISYNARFVPPWGFGVVQWMGLNVLPVAPLVEVALYFITRGHKVQLLTPKYYENLKALSRDKVDDVEAFKVLVRAGLIVFIEPPTPQSTLLEVMQYMVEEVHGCFISHRQMKMQGELMKRNSPKAGEDEAKIDGIDMKKRESVLNRSDLRMITPMFTGPGKTMVINTRYCEFVGTNPSDHASRKTKYVEVKAKAVLEYGDRDQRDYGVRLANQLTLGQQLVQILSLVQLYPLKVGVLRACQVILRFGRLCDMDLPEMDEFVLKNYEDISECLEPEPPTCEKEETGLIDLGEDSAFSLNSDPNLLETLSLSTIPLQPTTDTSSSGIGDLLIDIGDSPPDRLQPRGSPSTSGSYQSLDLDTTDWVAQPLT